MKLADFLASQGAGARPAATRTVQFRAVGVGPTMEALVVEAKADLVFISEATRQEALREAEKAIRAAYGADPVPEERREDECKYHVLCRIMRDSDDPRQPFANSVKELKAALVLSEASRIWLAYREFLDEEFPDVVDPETFERLVEEAKKVSLPDLISSFGFDVVRRSMPGLLAIHRTSLPPT